MKEDEQSLDEAMADLDLGLYTQCKNNMCNKNFIPSYPNEKYCSKECKNKNKSKMLRSRKKLAAIFTTTCTVCNATIKVTTPYSKRKYCSLKCNKEYAKVKRNNNIIDSLIKSAKQRAKIKNMEFNISESWIKKAELQKCCEVSGIKFTPSNSKKDPYSRSIDRKNIKLGYIDANIRLVCLWVNTSLNVWGDDILIKMCREIVKYCAVQQKS